MGGSSPERESTLFELGPNRYGKSAIRLVKVSRGADGTRFAT